MKKNTLSMIGAGLGASAVAGFGLSAGRDIYKSTKKSGTLIVLLVVLAFCPFFGARGLVRGHDRGFLGTLLLTYIGSFILIALGFIASLLVVFYFMVSSTGSGEERDAELIILIVIYAAILSAIPTVIGLLVGLIQRPKRLRQFAVQKYNQQFE